MRRVLLIVLFIVGAVAIAAGVLYLTQPAHSLPTFLPGYAAHAVGKHPKRGYAGIAFGVVLVAIAFVVAFGDLRRRDPDLKS
jgi:phosphoglycerol transferase MdoB-like AlkP superfamily enzyme